MPLLRALLLVTLLVFRPSFAGEEKPAPPVAAERPAPTEKKTATEVAFVPDENCPFLRGNQEVSVKAALDGIHAVVTELGENCKDAAAEAARVESSIAQSQALITQQLALRTVADPMGYATYEVNCANFRGLFQREYEDAFRRARLRLGPPISGASAYAGCFRGGDAMSCVHQLYVQRVSQRIEQCKNEKPTSEQVAFGTPASSIISTLGNQMQLLLTQAEPCLEKNGSPLLRQSLVSTTLQVASILAAFEPMTASISAGVAVSTTLVSMLAKKVYEGREKYDSGTLKEDDRFRRDACVYLSALPRVLGCDVRLGSAAPPAPINQSTAFLNYMIGHQGTSIRRLTTILEEVQAAKSADEATEAGGNDPLLDDMRTAFNGQVASAANCGRPDCSVTWHLAQVAFRLEKESARLRRKQNKHARNLAADADRLKGVLETLRRWNLAIEGDAKAKIAPASDEVVACFERRMVTQVRGLRKGEKVESCPGEDATRAPKIPSGPLDLNAILERYWTAVQPKDNPFTKFLAHEKFNFDGRDAHEHYLGEYEIVGHKRSPHRPSPQPRPVSDSSVSSLSTGLAVMKTELNPFFADELKRLARPYNRIKKGFVPEADEVTGAAATASPAGGTHGQNRFSFGRHLFGGHPSAAPHSAEVSPEVSIDTPAERDAFFKDKMLPLVQTCAYLASVFVFPNGAPGVDPFYAIAAKDAWKDPSKRHFYESICGEFRCQIPLFHEPPYDGSSNRARYNLKASAQYKFQQCYQLARAEDAVAAVRHNFKFFGCPCPTGNRLHPCGG